MADLIMVKLTCETCGKHFEAPRCHAINGRGRFCSITCFNRRPGRLIAAFWTRVEKTKSCWLWDGSLNKGYGELIDRGKKLLAHRVSWAIHNGPIPAGLHVLHNCPDGDNPRCVNPAHLFLGSQKDNVLDAMRKGRLEHGERHHSAKLNTKDVVSIRSNITNTNKEIAEKFGITPNYVASIRRMEGWKRL